MTPPAILLLEDDAVLLETLQDELCAQGYRVDTARHGKELLDRCFEHRYDLYLFDINVPYIDGLTLLKELRTSGDLTPAIFLTSRKHEAERIEGFEAGCDDYLSKPFSLQELKLRVAAILRRTGERHITALDDITIDPDTRTVTIGGESCMLDPKAMEILHLFIAHPGEILSISQIVDRLYDGKEPSRTVIRVHISKINALFPDKRIHNVRGLGYRYERL